ncbi:polymorphic toxin type 44 domain-containing protein [Alkalimonas mucilaginosa]|uniref:Polymorphic toxin type 44 domain-containing protein n=1 Tax=Alkalimonas mucilaginosa TaxID=3057676 RepID=A0ABU7JJ87_9GAMM|nr:polymorphic toxin type 44 domain-containing protein [Alkalimonas sp. MEB004]MEE2025747.1 polymorphic toxin type 44 domain-containing protein [Alkalimonas sp. MEB004]
MLHGLMCRKWQHFIWVSLAALSIGSANASCVELRENSEVTLSTAASSNGEICITLRDLHPSETYFMVDKSYPGMNSPALVGYDARWQLTNGSTVYNKNIYADFDMTKINLQSHDRATLRLKKAQNGANYDYTFNIINNREIQGFSIISVVMNAKPIASSQPTPPAPPPRGECDYIGGIFICTDPLRAPVVTSSSNAVLIGDIVALSGPQCNANNRPPTPAPYARDGSGRQLNLNKILRDEKAWLTKINTATSNANLRLMVIMQRNLQVFSMGAIYDVKDSLSPWAGNDDFGNFLYGAVMQVQGFSGSDTQRFSAAYQAIQNGNGITWSSATQGIYNFITNTGDETGDPEMVMRGYRYARDIHSQNPSDSKTLSCIDDRTLSQLSTPGTGGGSEGSDSSGIGGGGTLWSSCELWHFPSGLSNGMFYLETNCRFWMMPW